MIATKRNILTAYFKCNEEFFNSSLPLIEFDVIHSYKLLGEFSFYTDSFGNKYGEKLVVSDYYDFTEEQFINIVAHEMIHFALVLNGKDVKCSHGKWFKEKAEDFNLNYGLKIETNACLTDFKVREGKSTFIRNILSVI